MKWSLTLLLSQRKLLWFKRICWNIGTVQWLILWSCQTASHLNLLISTAAIRHSMSAPLQGHHGVENATELEGDEKEDDLPLKRPCMLMKTMMITACHCNNCHLTMEAPGYIQSWKHHSKTMLYVIKQLGLIIKSAQQDNIDGTSNIALPCPGG